MTCGSIYKIQFPNGKHYIGLTTTSLKQRERQHKTNAKSGDTRYLYNALRKYDMVDTFELIEIDTADTLEELCEKEIEYIKEYNSYYMNGKGYNMTYGGEGTNGYVFTEELKKQQSERRKKYYEENPDAGKEHSEKLKQYYKDNPEDRDKQSERMKIILNNPEIIGKMSESQQKRWDIEARREMSEIKKSYYDEHPEARKQHSEKMKKNFENPEAIQKNKEAQKKYVEEHPESRERMSEISKQYWSSQEAREQQSERRKKYFENPESREKNSESQKKRFENLEARQKMSEIKKKHYEDNPDARRKASTRGQHKPFDVFTIDGTYVKTFTYQFEAKEYLQKEYNITSTFKISEVLAGNRNSSAGFVFKYK